MPLPPPRGLYDPAFEHDACGLGFVADLQRPASHEVVAMGIEILRRLAHRGAAGSDPSPATAPASSSRSPTPTSSASSRIATSSCRCEGDYGVAQCFLSRDADARAAEMRVLEDAVRHHNQKVIGWRDVPIDDEQSSAPWRARRCR